ncbi:hypothetical protein BTVI_90533 [Pitangus sulphuratus]|nr:hypothetical protein BTVI_90533 [Pitangus sulphuratus]
MLHQGYSLSTGSDADSDTEGGMSPEHAIRLWGRGIKSRRSSGLSSRENSALTLTDSDNENKSDEENVFQCSAWKVWGGKDEVKAKTVIFTLKRQVSENKQWDVRQEESKEASGFGQPRKHHTSARK